MDGLVAKRPDQSTGCEGILGQSPSRESNALPQFGRAQDEIGRRQPSTTVELQ